ncbi:translesion DNA synthesis-associated protein ImuA [Pseudoxanthomonas suwonensis]|uniref:CDP-6-deoxy-delta-3,4-glucoseen reductase n=1 Tax=Pseudoxanthomonas suwonensis TaxID=314722 RepID=A0A0E3Z2X1_9GAMM|nr:translesion DNA synthesis-associated protein ImuA [Pseudoxanthomonas suwonensis]AKC87672.1 CDP-6-deoxy-delta-3,4-glucoseen reductase [Pseudoxanthomonas suwonensis]
MGAVVAIDALLQERRVWKGRPFAPVPGAQPTGHAALDAALPGGGWPQAALSELLLPCDGIGELRLLWPTLARLSQAGGRIVLVAPPYLPYAPAWQAAGIDLRRLLVAGGAATAPRDALWAAEQCLRSGSCAALLCWPLQADDRALRRLQVAAEAGAALAFATRPLAAARNPSPAALRIAIDAQPAQLRVLKCRGGLAPVRPIPWVVD